MKIKIQQDVLSEKGTRFELLRPGDAFVCEEFQDVFIVTLLGETFNGVSLSGIAHNFASNHIVKPIEATLTYKIL